MSLVLGCRAEAPGGDGTIGIVDAATVRPDVDLTGCSELVPLTSPEALATTPRDRMDIERLALATGDSFTAEPWIYDRLLDDLPRIRSAVPEIADIEHLPRYDRTLLVTTDYNLTYHMQSGGYTAWNCLNALYGVTLVNYELLNLGFDMVTLHFESIYDLVALAEQYAALPDLEDIHPSWLNTDGPTICATIDGEAFHYIFDRATGDCADGCTAHTYTYIHTLSIGATPVRVGQWSDFSGEPPPAWVDMFTPCR